MQIAAFVRALDILGESSKQALLYHLKEHYGIVLEDASSFSLERLNVALQDLVGEAAEVIMGKTCAWKWAGFRAIMRIAIAKNMFNRRWILR
jgi:hypothetical protein